MPDRKQVGELERYKQFIDVMQELASIYNIEELLVGTVQAAARICDAAQAWILWLDDQDQVLHITATTLSGSTYAHEPDIPLESSLPGWVLMNHEPVVINHVNLYDHSYGKIFHPDGVNVNSIFSLPIITRDKSIGVLEIINKLGGDFDTLDQDIMSSFANQVAIYIYKTHLFLQSDLVSELVHELRNPLASLNTAVQLLQRSDFPEEKRKHIFEMINAEFHRLADLTTSLLDYSRFESGRVRLNLTKFDLTELLSESMEFMQMQADGKDIKIILNTVNRNLVVTADRDKIKQVILNLLNNAIKYNHPGGKVTITAHQTPTDLSFSIQDTGQGIPAEYIPRLFDRFFRAPEMEKQSTGIGLGLTVCKQIVEAHKGKIEVTSISGKGSTFTVHLPLTLENS
jgi:signal transduction histidine kinase